MNTFFIGQSLINMPSVEHKCLNNIKKIYQHAGKCDDQQNLKDMIDAAMAFIPEEVTDVSTSLHITQKSYVKNASQP